MQQIIGLVYYDIEKKHNYTCEIINAYRSSSLFFTNSYMDKVVFSCYSSKQEHKLLGRECLIFTKVKVSKNINFCAHIHKDELYEWDKFC
jgi:hypothetical protein